MSIFYDLVSATELEDAHRIESEGYPEDEAGSLDAFKYRQSQAPELFFGAYLPAANGTGRTLIGFVCSTLSPDTTLTHASMSTHVPGADSVCIHSVCVASTHRRQHVGLDLLNAYVARLSGTGKYARILLIAHEELRPFYEAAGFSFVGQSAVVHGARPWFEMRKDLSPAQTQTQTQPQAEVVSAADPGGLPPGILEALRASLSRPRPTGRPLSSFPRGLEDVLEPNTDRTTSGSGSGRQNKHDLLCPRPGCGSVVLKRGAASYVERASVRLDLTPPSTALPLPECLGALPEPGQMAHWWYVSPNAMVFENIGFSKPAAPSGGVKMKLLLCADCDLGPLGWCLEDAKEFWVACNRVGYRE